jgi:hypothetical protein
MLLPQFDPPAFLNDLNATQKQSWSQFISQSLDTQMAGAQGHHFYNPMKTDTAADVQTAEISWKAFPRSVAVDATSDLDRWQTADGTRDVQDEYCEWSVTRDPATNKVVRVTFTCEGPEYWSFLASVNRLKVLALYQQFVSPSVVVNDLFSPDGQYNPRNKWNNSTSRGAMHLVQDANTLGAELNIAVRASIIRQINGTILTGERELIECGRYGVATRNSDPHIGAEINMLARLNADLTIANPVALYIQGLSTAGWAAPDGSDPSQYWTVVRPSGDADHIVRAVYEVPAGKGFAVGDITITGTPIQFGAQIADFITIKIVGQACRLGLNNTPPVTRCEGAAPLATVSSVAASLGRPSITGKR